MVDVIQLYIDFTLRNSELENRSKEQDGVVICRWSRLGI